MSDSRAMTCEEFQAALPALYDEGVALDRHPHVLQCPLCRALVADLERIAGEAGRRDFGIN